MKGVKLHLAIVVMLLSAACTNRTKENADTMKEVESTEVIIPETTGTDMTEFPDDREITYRSPEFTYGEQEYCYDKMLTPIDESEYKAVAGNYKNIEVDTTHIINAVNGVFTIPLKNGTTKTLENNTEEVSDAMVEYTYLGHIPSLGYYKFNCFCFAGSRISFLSQKSGEMFSFIDHPIFSPNRKQCAILNIEEEGAGRSGAIQAYQVEENGFTLLFALWSNSILPYEACWHHNTTLYIKAHQNDQKESDEEIKEFQYYKIDFSTLNE